jgi:RluA family pseudouridine synthase
LKKLFPNATRSLIYKLNRKEKIKIKFNWSEWKFKKKDNEYKLQIWDEVKIFLSDGEFEKLNQTSPLTFQFGERNSTIKENIVFEDWDLLVLNKNPGINVHPWDNKAKEISIIQQVQDYFSWKLDSLTFKPSLIHRIDRDTSWILLIAKRKTILDRLVKDLKTHNKIKKIYYALVLWRLSRKEWTIKKKLERIENAKNENKVQVSEKWQDAITHYKVLNEFEINTEKWNLIITELEIHIETGRMHQIRVHLSSIWNPILWDKIYWDKKLNSYFERNFWLKRQMLHSWKIEFFHYWKDKVMKLEARIKEDMKDFLEKIKTIK